MYKTLIDCNTLQTFLGSPSWVIVDCRFSLDDTAWGQGAYEAAHIPGAVYAHLDNDLSGPPTTDVGRHPLPPADALVRLFSRLGIGPGVQVVVYDQVNGMIASRLWWMLRYMGHTAVSVLDGGWTAWESGHYPAAAGVETNAPAQFTGRPRLEWLVQVAEVPQIQTLIDSRDSARYRGEMEPIDPVAGHIPGAKNYFYQENWGEDGRYLSADQIKTNLHTLLDGTTPDEAVFYCGSGVSACVNLLALAHAGLGNGRLYVGSWSEWSSDPNRLIAVGNE